MSSTKKNIQNLLEQLTNENGFEREKAREELVKKGEEVIPKLIELTDNPKHRLRWESMKALSEMDSKNLVPFFIEKLKNDESDIRWMAAEGLSKIGKSVIHPLLDAIIKDTDSVFLLSGAHHVIHNLKFHKQLPENSETQELLSLLKVTTLSEKLKTLAYQIINRLKQ